MSATDPRNMIKNRLGLVITTYTPTLDDNVTPASLIIVYSGSPENYKQWFYIYDYDAVITIDPPRMRASAENRRIQDRPIRYSSDVIIHITAIDKTTVTATKLLNKINVSIEQAIGTAASTYEWNYYFQVSNPYTIPMGGYDPLWRRDITIRFRPQSGMY